MSPSPVAFLASRWVSASLCQWVLADMLVAKPEHRAKAEQIWQLPPGTIVDKPGLHAVALPSGLKRLRPLRVRGTIGADVD